MRMGEAERKLRVGGRRTTGSLKGKESRNSKQTKGQSESGGEEQEQEQKEQKETFHKFAGRGWGNS
eukprot:768798-Hanusia_phi.AAC.2